MEYNIHRYVFISVFVFSYIQNVHFYRAAMLHRYSRPEQTDFMFLQVAA